MHRIRTFPILTPVLAPILALAFVLGPTAVLPASAQSGVQRLQDFDKTTHSGRIEAVVERYAPPDKSGKYGAPQRYPAQLLFERPDRFRMVVRPGQKNEYRAVAENGIVRWLDVATGFSGKAQIGTLVDPLAIALLDSAGELLRFTGARDLPQPKTSKIFGARLDPSGWGSAVETGVVWFSSSDGMPIGFQFRTSDGGKIHIAVLRFDQNVKTTPEDFQL